MRPPLRGLLAAAARTSAAHASVAAAVSGHDAAAEAAGGGVTEVDDAGERVGGVNRTGSRLSRSGFRTTDGGCRFFNVCRLRANASGPQSEILEQHLLLAGEETQL